jgi:hypothetical protein
VVLVAITPQFLFLYNINNINNCSSVKSGAILTKLDFVLASQILILKFAKVELMVLYLAKARRFGVFENLH